MNQTLIRSTLPIAMALILCTTGCGPSQDLVTVDEVNLEAYSGKWYEIARLPQRFEKDCACVTAAYAPLDDGNVSVKNTCLDTINQELRVSEGKAFPVEGSANSRLKVQFFFPFRGDYYILALGDNYQYAMVGSPNRSSLWILSRSPRLKTKVVNSLRQLAVDRGFDLGTLIYTPQYCDE